LERSTGILSHVVVRGLEPNCVVDDPVHDDVDMDAEA
jgi:hypothetical protein